MKHILLATTTLLFQAWPQLIFNITTGELSYGNFGDDHYAQALRYM